MLLLPALAACQKEGEGAASRTPAQGGGTLAPDLASDQFFTLPRKTADGSEWAPPLCLGLPVVLALTAQPALAVVPDWGLDMQASQLRDRLWLAALAALGVADPQAPSPAAASAAARLQARAKAGEPDWARAVALVLATWPAGKAATVENAQALAEAAWGLYGNVLGVPYQRLSIVAEQMPAGIIRPLRAGEAPLFTEPQLRAQGDRAVDSITVEYKDVPIGPLLADMQQRFGPPVLQEPHSAAHMQDLPNTVWQRGTEALVLLPRTETAADLHLMDVRQLDERKWFDRPFGNGDGADDPSRREQRIRQLAA